MPRLSVWMVRTALVYLALGFALGALLLMHRGWPLHPVVPSLLPVHAEFLLFGWIVQLALGVAFWILPRFRSGPERGNETPAKVAYVALNLGVLMVGCAGLVGAPSAALLGRAAEMLAAAAFGYHAWPRLKPFG
jgi:hypothetical protein